MSSFLTAFNSAMRASEMFRRSSQVPLPAKKPADPVQPEPVSGCPVVVINPVAIGRIVCDKD